jgi:hypothetical protein
MKLVAGTVVLGVLVAGVATAGAQSLADVARNEEARRKTIRQPARVYTVADIAKWGPVTAETQQAASTVTALDGTGKPVGEAAAAAGLPTNEEGWRARLQSARDGIDRNRLLVNALEQQARTAKARAGDAEGEGEDPNAGRAAEIKRLKAEIDAFRQTLDNAEEDARKAGVPPGWVR